MYTLQSDDTPFNPFYIGPHPSKACAAPEIPGRQCSPPCIDCKDDSPKQAANPGAAPSVPASGPGAMIIVGMAGPSGGAATIYSTTETLTAAAKAGASQGDPCAGKKMIECLQGGHSDNACE